LLEEPVAFWKNALLDGKMNRNRRSDGQPSGKKLWSPFQIPIRLEMDCQIRRKNY
jgi:hypothetical protein